MEVQISYQTATDQLEAWESRAELKALELKQALEQVNFYRKMLFNVVYLDDYRPRE